MIKKIIISISIIILLLLIGFITYIFYDNDDSIYVIGEFIENSVYYKRGYYFEKTESSEYPYRYYIAMGEKNTGGYNIKIKKVVVKENKVIVTVAEESPDVSEAVTQSQEAPACYIDFKKKITKIIIKNTNGEKFKYIKK